jgi:hypothetical protein
VDTPYELTLSAEVLPENGSGNSLAEALDIGSMGEEIPLLEAFSSAGDSPILFDELGNRLTSPEFRDNVDVVAPDGTNTTFFGFSDPDFDGYPNFFGTSASVGHAAGVAALLIEADPTATPAELYQALENTALDMDDPYTVGFDLGRDAATGDGLIQADLAIAELLGTAVPESTVIASGLDSASGDSGPLMTAGLMPFVTGAEEVGQQVGSLNLLAVVGPDQSDTALFGAYKGDKFDLLAQVESNINLDAVLADDVQLSFGEVQYFQPLIASEAFREVLTGENAQFDVVQIEMLQAQTTNQDDQEVQKLAVSSLFDQYFGRIQDLIECHSEDINDASISLITAEPDILIN